MRLRVLRREETEAIHHAAMDILAQAGVRVEDPDTRQWLKGQGCKEGQGGRLRIDPDLAARALATVRSPLLLYDRQGQVAVDTSAAELQLSPGLGCGHVLDFRSGKHRPCVLADIRDTATVCDKLPEIKLAASLGYPHDVAPQEEALATVRALVDNTGKPIQFVAHNESEAAEIWQFLAAAAGGWGRLQDKPFALELTGPTSPLTLGAEACRRLRFAAARHLPVVCYPGLIPGAAGPMTLAGALAQAAAEILAGLVVHQLTEPGAPVLSGSAILPMDMRTGSLSYGSPEYMLACVATSEYFADIGVPSWVGAGCSDSHTLDTRAAAEAGMTMMAAAFSATSLVHNLGYLSAGRTGSLEMLVLGCELAGMAARCARGIEVNQETLAVDVSLRACEDGSYLLDTHTREHVRTEMWTPSLFHRTGLEGWRPASTDELRAAIVAKLEALLGSRAEWA